MRRFILVFFFFCATACTPKATTQTHFLQTSPPLPITKSVTVDITLTQDQADETRQFEDLFWSETIAQGMAAIGNAYIQQAPLVQGIDAPNTLLCPKFFTQSGIVLHLPDPQTGDFHQSTTFTSTFIPAKNLAGQIIRLDQNRYIASMKDRIVFRLFSSCPIAPPAYFVVAEKIKSTDLPFLKIIGWGKVIQSLVEAPPVAGHAPAGTLCLAELEETRIEVEKGDIIFLLRISAHAMPAQVNTADPSTPGPDEIMVEPLWEEEAVVPLETK